MKRICAPTARGTQQQTTTDLDRKQCAVVLGEEANGKCFCLETLSAQDSAGEIIFFWVNQAQENIVRRPNNKVIRTGVRFTLHSVSSCSLLLSNVTVFLVVTLFLV